MPVLEAHRRRDPDATRASILEAAEKLFVDKGFAATSMSDVAQAAEVTKSLIHHHFGSKDELWKEVKRKRISHYAAIQEQLIAESRVGEKGSVLRESVATYFGFLRDNPEFVRLNAWMSLEDPKLSESVTPDLLSMGTERLRQEQSRGELRGDVEPRHILAAFLSLCMHWFTARNAYSMAHLMDPDDAVADDAYLEDVLKIFLEGVLPRSAPGADRGLDSGESASGRPGATDSDP